MLASLLQVSSDFMTCTIYAAMDTSWTILLHLSGFYFIQALDVERRAPSARHFAYKALKFNNTQS